MTVNPSSSSTAISSSIRQIDMARREVKALEIVSGLVGVGVATGGAAFAASHLKKTKDKMVNALKRAKAQQVTHTPRFRLTHKNGASRVFGGQPIIFRHESGAITKFEQSKGEFVMSAPLQEEQKEEKSAS